MTNGQSFGWLVGQNIFCFTNESFVLVPVFGFDYKFKWNTSVYYENRNGLNQCAPKTKRNETKWHREALEFFCCYLLFPELRFCSRILLKPLTSVFLTLFSRCAVRLDSPVTGISALRRFIHFIGWRVKINNIHSTAN